MDLCRSREMQRRMTEGPFGATVMQCHLADHACTGFVLKIGYESVGLRFAAMMGITKVEEYSDGGADLWESFDEMLSAHR